MRLLVLQLARFGDIFQTWPTLRALKRKYPDCELHVLVRTRFQRAMEGFEGVTVHNFDTAEILRPVMRDGNIDEAHSGLLAFIQPLKALDFDSIINLSFSPMSSFLADFLAAKKTQTSGYTRTTDGHLRIPDDGSAYFYAQVGIDRANRYHMTEIFAAVAGVELCDDDIVAQLAPSGPRCGVAVHLGASTENKTYPAELWVKALRHLTTLTDEPLTLLGVASEIPLSEAVHGQIGGLRVKNMVGQTALSEAHRLIASSKLLIGADSAPMHMATLSGTPVLNLSSAQVNFWETGPLTPGSRILYHPELQDLPPEMVAIEAAAMLDGQTPQHPCVVRDSLRGPYRLHQLSFASFSWRLIEALYTEAKYPEAESAEDLLAFQRIHELAELALRQLECWSWSAEQSGGVKILDQVDLLLPEIGRLNPRVEPFIQWFQTQRLRIPPGTNAEILAQTQSAFRDLLLVSSVYHQEVDRATLLKRAIELVQKCHPELREYNFNQVQDSFQLLISTLQELARPSTKVAGEAWSSILTEFNTAFERRDYICLADLLQWRLLPAFNDSLKESETLNQDMLS